VNADEVIANSVGATTTEAAADADCTGLPLSVTVAVKLVIPLTVGTPVIVPAEASVSPWGSLPEVIDHVYCPVPPVAAKVFENGVPRVTVGSATGMTESGVALTTSVRVADAVCTGLLRSETVTVKEKLPLVEVVPEIVPLEDSAIPAGRLPEAIDHEYGAVPPLARIVCE
jgi:hypothetical protein